MPTVMLCHERREPVFRHTDGLLISIRYRVCMSRHYQHEGGSEDPDAADLALAGHGDALAAGRLYDRHHRLVLRLAYRLTMDANGAEDVAQDSFEKLWRHAASLARRGVPVAPWLVRVTTNRCIDLARKRRERSGEDVPEMADGRPTAARSLALKQRDAILAAAVKKLPERQRQALALTAFGGLTNAAAGRQMKLSERAVESLVARARRGLRAALAEHRDSLLEWEEP
jgi:RNA polymerase sigma-70 factor (ECF subfamily)